MGYEAAGLSAEEVERLERVSEDLMVLSLSGVPAVAAAARLALAQVAGALSGQYLRYELYSTRLFSS